MPKKHQVLLGSEKVVRSLPKNLQTADATLFEHEIEKFFDETSSSLTGGAVIYPNGFIRNKYALLPRSDTFWNKSRRIKEALGQLRVVVGLTRRTKKQYLPETALFLSDEHSNNYFHWICDVLPKIQALVEASLLPFPAEHSVVLCADAATQYALDSLAAFGLTKIKIIGPAERLAVRGIRTVSPIAPTGNYRPHIMRGLRDRFATIRSTPPAAKKRIFISRSQAPRRKIQNESQLASILHDFGIDSVHLENLTFNQQVQLMQNAELVIGLHGAGLSNMVWMPSQSHILEIRFRGDASNNCYFSLASATDLQYWYLLADKTRNEDDTHDADAIVDPDRFRSVLAQIIAGLPA